MILLLVELVVVLGVCVILIIDDGMVVDGGCLNIIVMLLF